jgi:histidinol-phosphate/aromatic aminotransferase/cobyric acid decarboxylase-like protein
MAIYHVSVVFPNKNDLVDFTSSTPAPAHKGYEPTTSLEKIQKSNAQTFQKLDWNEGSISPPETVFSAIEYFLKKDLLQFYPELGGGKKLRRMLADYVGNGCVSENVIVTNGSDDSLILGKSFFFFFFFFFTYFRFTSFSF